MTTSWETCPQDFVWPGPYFGLNGSTANYVYSSSVPNMMSLDFTEDFLVATGFH